MRLLFFRSLILLPILLLFFPVCSNQEEEPEPRVEWKGALTASDLRDSVLMSEAGEAQLELFGISLNDILYDVDFYKARYEVEYRAQKINASAMITVPKRDGNPPLSIVAVQHRTILANAGAPSEWTFAAYSQEGLVMEGLFDSVAGGHISVNVDYLGFGDSLDAFSIHPYLIPDSYPNDVMEAIRTTREFARDEKIILDDNLFLRGYSEGAFASLAVQREIESDENLKSEFGIDAVAVGAGPYDLLHTVSTLLSADVGLLAEPAYAPYLYLALEEAHGWESSRMDSIFKTDTAKIRQLLDRSKSLTQVGMDPALTNQITGLFTSEALSSLRMNTISPTEPDAFREFKEKVKENSLHSGWTPQAPTRLYHCRADTIVPASNTATQANQLVGDNEITLLDHASEEKGNSGYVIDRDPSHFHRNCPLYSLPIKEWFSKF